MGNGLGVLTAGHAQTAPFLADSERKEALRAKAVIVLGRVRSVAVVVGRTGGEVGCQVQTAPPQALLVLGERKIHPPGPRRAQPRASE